MSRRAVNRLPRLPAGTRLPAGARVAGRQSSVPCPRAGWPLVDSHHSRLPQVGKLVPVRELSALTSPWYFGAVPAAPAGRSRKFATAWSQLQDPKGFLHR